MVRKEQRERERKKAAKGSHGHALSGFGFLPKKRSRSKGDLKAKATSQRQLVEEDISSRTFRQLQEREEGNSLQLPSSTEVSVKLIAIFPEEASHSCGETFGDQKRHRCVGNYWKIMTRPGSLKNSNNNFCSRWPAKCISGIERFR